MTFDDIDPDNWRRLVRAVEVIRITGRPFSSQRARWPERGRRCSRKGPLDCGGTVPTPSRESTPGGRHVSEWVDGRNPVLLALGLARNRTCIPSDRLPPGPGASGRIAGTLGNPRAGENQNATVRQTTNDLVPGQMDLEWLEIATNEEPTKPRNAYSPRSDPVIVGRGFPECTGKENPVAINCHREQGGTKAKAPFRETILGIESRVKPSIQHNGSFHESHVNGSGCRCIPNPIG